MKMKNHKRSFGSWAFLIGFVLALLFGIVGVTDGVAWLLVVFGLVVGFLNVTDKETQSFLLAGTVLVLVSALGAEAMVIIPLIGNILNAILLLFIPATIIVALKSVFQLARE
ncbi:MAG: hypothetical protein KKF89_03990 [Nanoarchaeota archaeon]|nr:hypothetical protein [Nanoarchaeota archaeon]MBU1854856.1 hypothetical protein [Nanoarchaeota archaeon]